MFLVNLKLSLQNFYFNESNEPVKVEFLAESQWSALKSGEPGDFQGGLLPVDIHWIKLYFLKMLTLQNIHCLAL